MKGRKMHDLSHISGTLRAVLKDFEKVTDDLEAIQAQAHSIANDDFLTRTPSGENNNDTKPDA